MQRLAFVVLYCDSQGLCYLGYILVQNNIYGNVLLGKSQVYILEKTCDVRTLLTIYSALTVSPVANVVSCKLCCPSSLQFIQFWFGFCMFYRVYSHMVRICLRRVEPKDKLQQLLLEWLHLRAGSAQLAWCSLDKARKIKEKCRILVL